MDLFISDEEMKQFLIKNGWSISTGEKTTIEFVHGSKIEYEDQKEIVAQKDGKILSLYQAFEKELKNKILQL
ncbi:hypothetical protein [Sphingobacterium multivorum]|uniref:hypothetical protein n=1 Tax=Sphingobacterium multivorum TaxID=28454 RepID=UPI0036A6FA88